MKKSDFILGGVIVIAAMLYIFISSFLRQDSAVVVVTVNGNVYGEYSLNEDGRYEIQGTDGIDILLIEGGEAKMVEADCRDGLCLNQKAISKNGETIVCLPNKIVVTARSTDSDDIDAIAK